MLVPCEIAVRSVLPAIRAKVAIELTGEHALKQKEAGSLLGVTQAAISQYIRKARGTGIDLVDDEEINGKFKEIAALLCSTNFSSRELRSKICDACEAIRRRRLMCSAHRHLEPELTKECELCLT